MIDIADTLPVYKDISARNSFALTQLSIYHLCNFPILHHHDTLIRHANLFCQVCVTF